MDRKAWLIERRLIIEERYDHLWAPIYDANWGATIEPLQRHYVTKLANACPADRFI